MPVGKDRVDGQIDTSAELQYSRRVLVFTLKLKKLHLKYTASLLQLSNLSQKRNQQSVKTNALHYCYGSVINFWWNSFWTFVVLNPRWWHITPWASQCFNSRKWVSFYCKRTYFSFKQYLLYSIKANNFGMVTNKEACEKVCASALYQLFKQVFEKCTSVIVSTEMKVWNKLLYQISF